VTAKTSLRVEKLWVLACFSTALVWLGPLLVSALNNGLGIWRRNGDVVLAQGHAVRRINQTLGNVLWWSQEAGLVLVVVCAALALWVWLRNATVQPSIIFSRDAVASQTYPWLMRSAVALVLLPIAVAFAHLAWLALMRVAL
jgi:hypothetical protein